MWESKDIQRAIRIEDTIKGCGLMWESKDIQLSAYRIHSGFVVV